ncbi:hypothetical protein BH23ACT9_BH23ACT9_15990 [soil metagenome]
MSDATPPAWGRPTGPPSGPGSPAFPPAPPQGYGRTAAAPPPPPPPDPAPPARPVGLIIGVITVLVVVAVVALVGSAGDDEQQTATDGTPAGVTEEEGADPATGSDASPAPAPLPTPEPFPLSTPTPEAGQPGETPVSVFDLTAGTCFNDFGSSQEIQLVPVVDCDVPHDNEVFALIDFPAGPGEPFPGLEPLTAFADEQCRGALFSDYVGTDYPDSRYFASRLTPTAESWGQDDREIICLLYDSTTQITGSAAGTAQ